MVFPWFQVQNGRVNPNLPDISQAKGYNHRKLPSTLKFLDCD